MMPPFNIPKFLKENSHLMQPPVNNYSIHKSPLTVMIVGGPNARSEYHINVTPEVFFMYKGRMLLKTVDPDGAFRDNYVDEGELFLLPANTPHNPVRFENTAGIVIELPRPDGVKDILRWYCQSCGNKVFEDSFICVDLGAQIKASVNAFKENTEARKCGHCGETCDVAPSLEEMERMRTGPHEH